MYPTEPMDRESIYVSHHYLRYILRARCPPIIYLFYTGTCRDLVGNYDCSCRSGFSGKNCETRIFVSSPSPVVTGTVPRCGTDICGNGGTCYQDSNSTYCICPLWHSGKRCETSLREDNASQVFFLTQMFNE